MEAKAKSSTNVAKALSPTAILLFAVEVNGHVGPAATVAKPKMAAAPPAPAGGGN